MIDIAKIADAEQQAVLATLQRDLAIAQNQLHNLRLNSERLEKDNEELSQQLMKKGRREGESSMLMERLGNLRVELREIERARDQSANQAVGLEVELEQCRNRLQQIQGIDPEEFQALRDELEEQRENSRKALQELQSQLDEHEASQQKSTLDSDSVLEVEVLRQEHEVVKQTLEERQSELLGVQQTCQLLEDELEDAHGKIDELRSQYEKQTAELQQLKKEAEKQQEENVAEILARNIEEEVPARQSVPVLDIKTAGLNKRRGLVGGSMLAGLLMAVVLLEVLSFVLGHGELLTHLLSSTETVMQSSQEAVVVPHEQEPLPQQNSQSGQIIRN